MTTIIRNKQCAITDDRTYITEGWYTLEEENGIYYASLRLPYYNKTFKAEATSREEVSQNIEKLVKSYIYSAEAIWDWYACNCDEYDEEENYCL